MASSFQVKVPGWLTKLGTDVLVGLPDRHEGTHRIDEHGHAAGIEHVHGTGHHLTTRGGGGRRALVRVGHADVHGPERRQVVVHLRAQTGHVLAVQGEQAIAAGLGSGVHLGPRAEQGAVELGRGDRVGLPRSTHDGVPGA